MNSDLAKKIKALNVLADGSLSILSLSDHKWQIHAYQSDTLLGNGEFFGKTLEEAVDKTLQGVANG